MKGMDVPLLIFCLNTLALMAAWRWEIHKHEQTKARLAVLVQGAVDQGDHGESPQSARMVSDTRATWECNV